MSGLASAAINGVRELWANRMRSLLSMSGIILGVAALVIMLAVARSLLLGFRQFVATRGGVEHVAIVGAELPREQEHLAGVSRGLTLRDAAIVASATPLTAHISPELAAGEMLLSRSGREVNARVIGCTPDFLAANRRAVASGRFLADFDLLSRANVCVLGAAAADSLFARGEKVLGATLTLNARRFVVVGVLDRVESSAGRGRAASQARWSNLTVCIPLQTATARLTGSDRLTGIAVRVRDAAHVPEVAERLEQAVLDAHHGIRDFRVETNEETLAEFRRTERTFVLSLAGVALIALLVGGAGIMNVMLASIHERTREIGVRLALGARSADIFIQFLMESAVVGAFGGLIGLGGAFAFLSALRSAISGALPDSAPVTLSQEVMLIGVAFSCTIGFAAGVYPALRASRLNPIDALRSE